MNVANLFIPVKQGFGTLILCAAIEPILGRWKSLFCPAKGDDKFHTTARVITLWKFIEYIRYHLRDHCLHSVKWCWITWYNMIWKVLNQYYWYTESIWSKKNTFFCSFCGFLDSIQPLIERENEMNEIRNTASQILSKFIFFL